MSRIKGVKGLLFDYGGTLDSGAVHWAYVLSQAYEAAGYNFDDALFREAYVFGERTLAQKPIIKPLDNFRTMILKKVMIEMVYLVERGLVENFPELNRRISSQVADFCYQYAVRQLYESREVLDVLREKYPMVLVTNFYGNINTVLKDFGLKKYFVDVVESAVVGVRKPDPEIFRLGVKALGVEANDVCVIGDSFDKDIVPAKSIGCKTIWFKGKEWTLKDYDESLPDNIIKKIGELPYIL